MMNLFTPLSPLLLVLALAAPPAEAGGGGLSASYRQASPSGSFGVHLQVGTPTSSYTRGPRRHYGSPRYGSPRYGTPTWTRPAPTYRRAWVPGRWEVVQRKVWVPGFSRQEWVPPIHETRYDWCGRPYTVLRSPGHYRTIQEPGHWEYRSERIWREPHWQ